MTYYTVEQGGAFRVVTTVATNADAAPVRATLMLQRGQVGQHLRVGGVVRLRVLRDDLPPRRRPPLGRCAAAAGCGSSLNGARARRPAQCLPPT